MNKSIGALSVLFAAASMLAGCNGNGYSPAPSPTSTPSGTCGGPPSSNQMEVIYPIPGTRKAPPNLLNIYVSTKGTLPPSNSFDFFLELSTGATTYTGLFTPVSYGSIPTPHATPTYPNPTYYASPIAGPYGSSFPIGPDVTVTGLWNDGGRNCIPHFEVFSFRTASR
jgi:hypothetical protein